MIVLLPSRTFSTSRWTMEEVDYARTHDLSLMMLRMPDVDPNDALSKRACKTDPHKTFSAPRGAAFQPPGDNSLCCAHGVCAVSILSYNAFWRSCRSMVLKCCNANSS